MKNKLFIANFILFVLIVSSCKDTEKVDPKSYTIKGVIYHTTPYKRLKNQKFDVEVYKPGFLREWDYVKTLGYIITNDTGYFEFSYSHQNKGTMLELSGQFFNISNLPINTEFNKSFYNSNTSTVNVYLNTNNKVSNKDTFFLLYRNPSGNYAMDSIYKNYNGFYRTIKSCGVNFPVCAGIGKNGLKILDDYSGFLGDPEFSQVIPLKGDPYIDSVYINY